MLRRSVALFDRSWASFEHLYISELIGFEARARSMLFEAVSKEELLTRAETVLHGYIEAGMLPPKESEINVQERRQELVTSICRLNAVANTRRKGRDDLDVQILEESLIQQGIQIGCDTTRGRAASML